MNAHHFAACAALITLALSGCVPGGDADGQDEPPVDTADGGIDGAPDDPPEDMLGGRTIRGPVRAQPGYVIDPDVQLFGLWIVSAGSPDTAYVWGHGEIEGDRFAFHLPDDAPPAEALNDHRPDVDAVVGVGVILALPAQVEAPPAGPLDRDTFERLEDALSGAAPRYGLIYVEGGGFPPDHWGGLFESGALDCGVGEDREEGFDAFSPVDCDEVELLFGMPLEFVNWT